MLRILPKSFRYGDEMADVDFKRGVFKITLLSGDVYFEVGLEEFADITVTLMHAMTLYLEGYEVKGIENEDTVTYPAP